MESVRLWVRQADIDEGHAPGTTTEEDPRVRRLELENRHLRRANAILLPARIAAVERDPDAWLFTGPRGGRITTAILRDATHWDEVVAALGFEHLQRHDLRHTGLT